MNDAAAMAHPHDLRAGVPHRLPATVVRALSTIDPWRALSTVAMEWLTIGVTIAVAELVFWPWLYPLAVVIIGARQAALTVIGHDAAHHRLLPSRVWNDVVGDLLATWPTFFTLSGFRKYHGEHHQYLGEPEDGNRVIWRTHRPDGTLRPEWTYPKSWPAFAWKIAKRSAGPTGIWWILRGNVGAFVFVRSWAEACARVTGTVVIAAVLTATRTWSGFLLYWIVPFCTWHMTAQYVRLVCEHSGLPHLKPGAPSAYALTRTTLARPWERWLLVPCNIHYHAEHHFYPSVPFYNLPALHQALMDQPGYRENAVITPSVVASIRQVVSAPA
jgi:fatty acid desaturase